MGQLYSIDYLKSVGMKEQNILVLGGSGKTGRRVAERLRNTSGIKVRSASRSTIPGFDWENPVTWEAAIGDTDAVCISFQPDLAVPSAPETIKQFTVLATQLGVRKMVLLSGRGEKEAAVCEKIVMQNASSWTIVRASWFNQNFDEGFFLEPILAGHVALPRRETLEPFVDADDIADVAVAALLNDEHNGKVYELTGPELLTFEQAVAIIAKATGRTINFQALSLEEYSAMLRSYGVPEDTVWLANYLFSEILDGRNASISNDVEKVLGRKAKEFSNYAQKVAQTGVWNLNTVLSL